VHLHFGRKRVGQILIVKVRSKLFHPETM
jgi:hypothetical protein